MRKTKNQNPAIKILPGFVARVRVRCGKANCKCARGERHIAFYHVTYDGGRFRRYIRKRDVEEVRARCEAHRQLQAQIRAGRREYARLMLAVKALLNDRG